MRVGQGFRRSFVDPIFTSHRPSARRRKARAEIAAIARAVCERVEPRIMLTATLDANVPTLITAGTGTQAVLSPGTNSFSVAGTSTSTATHISEKFVVNNAVAGQATVFTTSGLSTVDAAIAVYDASGNRILLQDADTGATKSDETLSAVLTSGQLYTVSAYAMLISGPSQTVTMTIVPGPQTTANTVAINPATGTGSLTTSASPNAFTGSTSVRYFPLSLLNAATSGNVVITPTAPDTAVDATLFVANGSDWSQVSTGTLAAGAASLTLAIAPPSNQDITDGTYLLAVAPLNFTAAAEPVTITATATSLVGPATVSTSAATGGIGFGLSAVGTVTGSYSGTFSNSTSQEISFIAPFTGTMTITDLPTSYYGPKLSVFGPGGTSLLTVASQYTPGISTTATFNVTAGSSYYLLAGAESSSTGTFTLSASQQYTPTPVAVTSAVGQQTSLPLSPYNGSSAFQLTAPAGSNYLALQVSPDAGNLQTQISVIAPNQTVRTYTATSTSSAVTVVLDESVFPGPYDVVLSGIAGTGNSATFKYVALTVPTAIAVNQFPAAQLNLATGGLSTAAAAVTTATPVGVQYYQLPTNAPLTLSAYSATSAGGATAVVAHYVQTGGTFRLFETAAPGSGATASVNDIPPGNTLNAVVAIPVDFSGSGTVQLAVAGPLPVGTPVQLGYNIAAGQPAPSGALATASVNGQIAIAAQRDLYAVQVPYDLNSSSASLVVTPTDAGGPLALTVQVLTAVNTVITTANNTPGQPVTIPLTGLTAGQTIRFLVQPVAGTGPGGGGYSLVATFSTGDTSPHFVTEQSLYPYSSSPINGNIYLPNITPTNINFGTTGGSAGGQFISSTSPALSDGHGAVQLFTVTHFQTSAGFMVTTTDVDPGVNTDIALFGAVLDSNYNIIRYDRLAGTAPSFDYYPSDRSTVDSRIVINNTDLDPVYFPTAEFGPNYTTILVVVMNEHGSQGRFTVTAAPAPVATAGPGTGTNANDLLVSAQSGNQYLANQQLTTQTVTSVGYSLRTPAAMGTGTTNFTVKTRDGSTGQSVTISISRNGIIFVASLSGTIGTGGTVTLGTTALGRLSTYSVTVSLSSVPSQGVTIGVAVPPPTSGIAPTYAATTGAPPDGGYSSTYFAYSSRLDPAPNGSFSATPFTGSDGLITEVFNIQTEGTFTYHVAYGAAAGVVVGLYEAGQKYVSGTGYVSTGVLLDYTNAVDGNSLYSLTDYLSPGTYFITGQASSGAFGNKTVTGSIPALNAKVVNVEPANGITSVSEETILNQGQIVSIPANGSGDQSFISSRYASASYAFTVPANTNGSPVSVTISDNDANAGGSPVGLGTASVTLWKLVGGVYTQVPVAGSGFTGINDPAGADVYTLTANEPAVAGTQYFADVDLDGFSTPVYVGVTTPVISTGRPDYSVAPIVLTANYGSTLVSTTVTDASGTVAPAVSYTLQLGNITVTRSLPALAPYGSVPIQAVWNPLAPTDVAAIAVNPGGTVAELVAGNDAASTPLSSVDPTAPTGVTIALSDPAMTAEGTAAASAGGGVWGRYISGVTGQAATITFAGIDPDGDLLDVTAVGPNTTGGSPLFNLLSYDTNGATTQTTSVPVDFGNLAGTSDSDSNQITFYAIDRYGLRTYTHIQTLDVAMPPSFLTGGTPAPNTNGAGGSITFNASNHQFTYNFQDSIVSVSESLSTLLGFSVPVVGDKTTGYLVAITGTGTSGLTPNTNVTLTLTGKVQVTAVGDLLFNKSYSTVTPSSDFSFVSQLTLNGRTLVPGSAEINLTVKPIQLINYTSPLIPLLSVGVPGIASLDAGVKFGVAANVSAGATLGLNPSAGSLSGILGSLGVMSPTFIQSSIEGTASVTGQADVLGFDVADVSGSIGLTLTATLGLDNAIPGAIIPFNQAYKDLALSIDAKLTIGISASVFLIGNVFTYNYNKDLGNIVNTIHNGIFLTNPPVMNGSSTFIPPGGGGGSNPAVDPTAVTRNGSSPVGVFSIDPTPQITISNNSTAMGLSVQVINVGTANAPQGNLAYSVRPNSSSAWGALTTLPQTGDVSDPVLAMSRDGSGSSAPAVVVYDADDTAGSPATQTLNQRLDASDIRYRYFNGTSWGPEIALTNDNLEDTEQAIAFDSSGDGVLAYVRNTDSAPISASGSLDSASNDIYASTWNATTHTWNAPTAITSGDGVDDSKPSVFVDATGKRYIVWVRGTGSSETLMYSTSTGGGAWSTPAVLSVTGLVPGGTFNNVAIGSDGPSRVNVLFSYTVANGDGTNTTTLYQRPATTAGFTNSLPAVQISANANYSGLQTTETASGSLVAYWEQSDGTVNQIFETTITAGVATAPVQLTDDPNVAQRPSVAVDTSGKLQVLYDNNVLYGGTSQGTPADPSVGAPLAAGVASSSVQMLPQLTFTQGLAFPVETQTGAPTGSTATATAVIANRGLVAATVTITAYDGIPGSGGTAVGTPYSISLLPGATYNVSQAFTVLAGNQIYSIQLTTSSGQAFDTTENISSTTLNGAADLYATGLTDYTAPTAPGQAITLYAFYYNNATTATGPFTVTFYSGDQLEPQLPVTAIASVNVSSVSGLSSGYASINITLPAGAGDDVYTDVVDSGNVIAESNELNNESRIDIVFQADPAIYNAGSGSVVPTLLNSTTSNNVSVLVNVTNNGTFPLYNVPIDLLDSRNGQAAASDGQMIIAELDPGAAATATFTVTSLAGDNLFTAEIDPSVYSADSNLANDTGTGDLYVPGLPTVVAAANLSTGSSAAGSPLTLTATLTNTGIGDAANIPLTVLATLTSGGPSYVIGAATGNLTGLGSQTIPITLNTTSLLPGTYTITLEVDPSQTILQGSVAGNLATATEVITGGVSLTNPAEYLRLDANGTTLDIWDNTAPTGTEHQVLLSSVTSLTADAPSGSQNITVDFSAGDPLPSGGLNFIAPAGGTNILNIVGTTGNDTATVNGSTITFASGSTSASVTYSNVTTISFNGSTGSDALVQTAQPGGGAGLVFANSNSSDTLAVNGGRFTFLASSGSGVASITLGAVNVASGGVVAMSPPNGQANRSVLILNTLSLTGTGTLDLSSNDLVVHTTPLATIDGYVASGYNHGSWTGFGITSSAAAADAAHLHALGTVDNNLSSGGTTTLFNGNKPFDLLTPLANDTIIKYTYVGDANLDGKVDGSDYSLIDGGYASHGSLTSWYNGNFNYDAVVDGSDYALIDNSFNNQGSAVPAVVTTTAKQAAAAPAVAVTAANADVRVSTKVSVPKIEVRAISPFQSGSQIGWTSGAKPAAADAVVIAGSHASITTAVLPGMSANQKAFGTVPIARHVRHAGEHELGISLTNFLHGD
jgi:hypothetical protein